MEVAGGDVTRGDISLVDFLYLSDALTRKALEMLRKNVATRGKREAELLKNGYPA